MVRPPRRRGRAAPRRGRDREPDPPGGPRETSGYRARRPKARSGSSTVIPDVKSWLERPSPTVLELARCAADTRQILLEARRAEDADDSVRAAAAFERALARAACSETRSRDEELTRASALAGSARMGGDEAHRREAAQIFGLAPREELDGAELADWASVVADDDDASAELWAAALSQGVAPLWAYWNAGIDALYDDRGADAVRWLDRAVRAAPLNAWFAQEYATALEERGASSAAARMLVRSASLS